MNTPASSGRARTATIRRLSPPSGAASYFDARLDAPGFRLVFLTRAPGSFEAARAERLKVSGNPAQYEDLRVFIEEQERMRRLVGESRLPRLEGDISDHDMGQACERIADGLEATGGLRAR